MQHRRTHQAASLLNLLQLPIDICACVAGFYLAFMVYRDTSLLEELKGIAQRGYIPQFSDYYIILAAFTAVVVVSFTVKHLYQSRETGLMNMDEAVAVLQGLLFASLVVVGGNYVFVDPHKTGISRLIVGLGLFLGCVLVLMGRALGFKVRRYLQSHGHFFRRVVICGTGEAARTIARKLLHSPKFHILPVAFLDNDESRVGESIECLAGHDPVPVAGTLEQIESALEKLDADEVWIALPDSDQETIVNIARAAGDTGVPCRFVPNLYQLPLEALTMEALGGVPLLSIKPRATMQPIPITKRAFDIVFSLIVLFNPVTLVLWPLIVLLVRSTSHGPAIFTQERVGQGGRPFKMFKFRTMFADAPAYATTPQHPADRRITPLGRWLRKLSVDELPQFWNVLIGDMSVVGPRPEMPHIVAQYNSIQRQRLCVKPGITGIWQISADRKNPIHENIDYDLYYIEKQSLSLDLMIILTTGFYGARGV